VAEGDFVLLIRRAGLPEPMLNPRLFAGETFIASPDCWWPRAGLAAEVDSREWHLSPADWERTLARHRRMTGYGITVLHFTPGQIAREPKAVTRGPGRRTGDGPGTAGAADHRQAGPVA
jgi:hypothetical protein